jgi:hypothetical protein
MSEVNYYNCCSVVVGYYIVNTFKRINIFEKNGNYVTRIVIITCIRAGALIQFFFRMCKILGRPIMTFHQATKKNYLYINVGNLSKPM